MDAKRYDDGKIRLDLVPTSLIEEVGKVLTFGAKKYDEHNWKKGMKWSRCIASLKRHIQEFENCKDFDDESSLLHLGHAATNIAFLIEYYKIHPELDDRWRNPSRRIGLDIDDVLLDFVPTYCKRYGLEIPNSWYLDYNIIPRIDELTNDENFWLDLEPLIDPNLLKFEPTVYITARDERLQEYTSKWLEKHNFPKAPIIFSRNKGKTCQEYELDLFIDDSPKNFREINEAGIACYLLDQPWNRYTDVGYRRIYNLNDVI